VTGTSPIAEGRRGAGELESAVLAALWAADTPLTPAQVQTSLAAAGHQLAYTSVMTTLSRLHVKGLLDRSERGRAYAYQPTPDAADAAASRMRSLLGAGPARALVLSRFVAGLDPADEQLLQDALARATSAPVPADRDTRAPRRRVRAQ
jgi:predicted transcriptional regulator